MGSSRRLRLLLLGAVAAVAAAAGLVAYATELLNRTELDTVDARFAVRGDEGAPEDLIVVAVDDRTFQDLQERWPFPRSFHAKVIERLSADGAKAVAYDVQFTEPTTPREDNALIRAVGRARHVVLATTEVGRHGGTNVLGGDRVLDQIGARAANSNFHEDPGGVIRQFPYSLQGLESFAVATSEEVSGEQVSERNFDDGEAWIDYRGPPGTLETIPFSKVMRGEFEADTFRDKIAVVGAEAPSLQDVHATSSGGGLMSGPEIQANAISTVRRGLPLTPTPDGIEVLLILAFAVAAPLASLKFPPIRVVIALIGAGGLYLVATQVAFGGGLILPVVYPLLTGVVASGGTLGAHYLATAFERQRTRDIFARFVPERVVDQVLARTDEDLRLGGVKLEGTILFSDVRGFTTFSETQPAERVLEILNRYLSGMSDAILDHGGTITTYIGDGIMALFGAPIEQPDHADRALAAARAMLTEKLPEFNAWLREQGIGEFKMGIGLNTGPVMAGNVGSDRRLEYTAIGDTVNTAARLEGMTKGTPHELFISDSTRDRLTDAGGELVYVDELPVRGRQAGVKVWALEHLGGASEGPEHEQAVT